MKSKMVSITLNRKLTMITRHVSLFLPIAILAIALSSQPAAWADGSGAELYKEHCESCHHPKRLGLTAPPLIPESFSRGAKGKLSEIIKNGLPATQMPSFGEVLTDNQIKLLTEFIKTPVKDPVWTFDDISFSRISLDEPKKSLKTGVDIENITLVMERGTKSLAVLDGANFDELAKFRVGAVHGGPKFSYSLDKIYALARDGAVTVYDLKTLRTELRLKAGINSRSIAVSGDDKTIAVANYLPENIVFFNERMEPVHEIKVDGKIGGFYAMPDINSFVMSFREKPELWIIRDKAPFNLEKRALPEAFHDFSISPKGPYIIGTKRGSGWMYIYDYEKDDIVAKLSTSGLPHLASAAFWMNNGKLFAGVNHIKKPAATIISMDRMDKVAELKLPGAGFFVRTHYATPYLWIDTETDKIALVDKNNFSNMRFITPRKGRKAMHVEFTKDGGFALVTIPGPGGEVVIYDARALKEVRSIPFERPVGKYNAVNKTFPERSLTRPAPAKAGGSGKAVFDSFCMGCHHQTYEAFGPSFAKIAKKRNSSQIKFHILSPEISAKKLGYERNSMPRIKLTNEQLKAIVEYILSFG